MKSLVSCMNKTAGYGATGLVLFVTFTVYVSLGNTIDSSTAFSSIAILILSTNMVSLIGTAGITQIYLILTSMKRFTQALLLKERVDYESETKKDSYSLKLKNCSFS